MTPRYQMRKAQPSGMGTLSAMFRPPSTPITKPQPRRPLKSTAHGRFTFHGAKGHPFRRESAPLSVASEVANEGFGDLDYLSLLYSLSEKASSYQLDAHCQNDSKAEASAFTTLPRLEHHGSDEQTGGVRSDYENNIEVLKAAVFNDVKDRIPFGENDSFQWSMEKIYIWNLIKC